MKDSESCPIDLQHLQDRQVIRDATTPDTIMNYCSGFTPVRPGSFNEQVKYNAIN